MKILCIFLFIFISLISCNKSVDTPEAVEWKSDIDEFASTLESNHKNLFFQLDKKDFYDQIESIKKQCSTLSDVEIVIELSKLLTKVGDAHTTLSMNAKCFTYLPFSFIYLNDGLFCYKAPLNYSELVGKVVKGIDNSDFETIYAKYAEIIPHENQPKVQLGIQRLLLCPEILEALDIISNKQQFVVHTQSGIDVEINTADIDSENNNFLLNKTLPIYLEQTNVNYWFKTLSEEKLLYLQYNNCREIENYSFKSFTENVMKEIEKTGAEKMIIDLRWNGGGNSAIMDALLNALKEHQTINQQGRIFVIIGKNTFSSAILNALDLKSKTQAILIGEPTGGKPNHYGEVKSIKWSKLDLYLSYSTKYFKRVDGDPASIEPDVFVPVNSYDMVQLNDPCLEYVLNR